MKDRGNPRTLFVEQIISDARLSNYTELKRLARSRESAYSVAHTGGSGVSTDTPQRIGG
jgi:hypothetical protein